MECFVIVMVILRRVFCEGYIWSAMFLFFRFSLDLLGCHCSLISLDFLCWLCSVLLLLMGPGGLYMYVFLFFEKVSPPHADIQ
jgi:hypothetical protein